jgi:hypothetical protein
LIDAQFRRVPPSGNVSSALRGHQGGLAAVNERPILPLDFLQYCLGLAYHGERAANHLARAFRPSAKEEETHQVLGDIMARKHRKCAGCDMTLDSISALFRWLLSEASNNPCRREAKDKPA